MDNPANNEDPVQNEEVSPGVTPIHDEAAKVFEEENAARLKQAEESGALVNDDDDKDEASATAHNVFEQTTYTGESVPTAGELAAETTYEGGCAS